MVHFGLFRAIFRRSGLNAFVGVLSALGAYGLLFACVFTVVGVLGVPRSIGVFQPFLLLLVVGLPACKTVALGGVGVATGVLPGTGACAVW